MQLPLFPLGTVLFPHGRLPLRVFEPRYVDLVRDCLKRDAGFGVVWIREGREVVSGGDTMPRLAQIGTVARIVDWDGLPDGHLGVTIEGGTKFRLLASEQRANFLVVAEVELLPGEPELALPERAHHLPGLMLQLMQHPLIARLQLRPELEDGGRLANQLAQLLPIPEAEKFALLAEMDPRLRLDRLTLLLEQLSD
jgi:Lon protease-like protein